MAFDKDEDAEAKVPLQSAKSPQIVISTNNADFPATSTSNKPNGVNIDNEYSSPVQVGVGPPNNSYQKMEPSADRKHKLARRESHAFAFGFSSAFARLARRICGGKTDDSPDADLQIVGESHPPLYRTTPRRWIMLMVFAFYSMSNAFQWIEYAIISDKITYFYGVSVETVNWTSMIYMLTYIPLVFPATWLLDKKGLRVVALIGAFGNFLGSAVKCFSAYPGGFLVTFAGQTIAAMSQIFILGLPARLAAVWFSATEVSFATAIGVFGNQLGIAIGFLLPPILVPGVMVPDGPNGTLELYDHNLTRRPLHDPNNCTIHDLYGQNLANMFYGSAAINGFLFLVVLFVFQDAPHYPPSAAQAAILAEAAKETYLNWVKVLVKNWNFIILLVSYGINVGVFYAISTLLNECILYHYPGQSENAGRIGLTIVLSGLIGSFIGGLWLSWSGNYKATTFIIYLLSFLSMIAFTFTLDLSLWIIFVVAACLGFFMTGYLPVGFEFAAEITYPAPEGTSSGLLNCFAQIFGLLLTDVFSRIIKAFGGDPLNANGFLAGCLFLGTIMTFFIKSDLRRTQMNTNRSAVSLASAANVPTIQIENIQMTPNNDNKFELGSSEVTRRANNAVFSSVGNNDL